MVPGVSSFISCILRLESLLVGNIIEKVLLMQIMIEQALQNCDDGDSSGNIPFSKSSLVNWFCKNQKGTTFVLPFNVLISNWAMGEILYFSPPVGISQVWVAFSLGHIKLLEQALGNINLQRAEGCPITTFVLSLSSSPSEFLNLSRIWILSTNCANFL